MIYDPGLTESWPVLGDFNSVLRGEEKRCGQPVTSYQVKDLADCCLAHSPCMLRSLSEYHHQRDTV